MEITLTTVGIIAVVALVISLATAIPVSQSGIATLGVGGQSKRPQCNDGIDNDGDGLIDYPSDSGCVDKGDKSELNPSTECDDGKDNDLDGAVDLLDTGCSSSTDNDETNCGDNVCESVETCLSCSTDCLKTGQVCCGGVAYNGNCCSNSDCSQNYICVNHTCTITFYCGDGVCNGDETCSSCQTDCGQCDSCSDTDGGYNVGTKGTVSGYKNNTPYNYTDYCISNTTSLKEHYCLSGQQYSDTWNCAGNVTASCINGACA